MSKLIIVIAAVNGVAVAVLGVSRLSWPSAEFWQTHAAWVIAALVITGGVPIVQALMAERGERGRRTALEREEAVRTLLVMSLVYLVRHCGADWERTGVQAFLVRRRWNLKKEQVRVAKIRLASIPASGIVWTEGKGAIGRCWATRTPQFVDLEQHFAPFSTLSEGEWEKLSAETRYGLTHDDFLRLRGKYGIVAAVPIIGKADEYLGCIALDVPPGWDTLDRERALESLATAAGLVPKVLGK